MSEEETKQENEQDEEQEDHELEEETLAHWIQTTEQLCRAWIFEKAFSTELDGESNLRYMNLYQEWLLNGKMPSKEEPLKFGEKIKKHLKND